MVYYNPDGSQSLCGNGSRCAVKFAMALGIVGLETTFLTIEGPLFAKVRGDLIQLRMPDVERISPAMQNGLFLHTGSPHFVRFVDNVHGINVYKEGKALRYHKEFSPGGTNVNFVQWEAKPDRIIVRTYERGVENETLSCGTGVTASALATGSEMTSGKIHIKTLGGNLEVWFEQVEKGVFRNIYLIGPAEKVFEGTVDV
jgi:diaminopimelate epimerase